MAPLLVSICLVSCVDSAYPGSGNHQSQSGAYGIQTTLPINFVGSAYYYNGRYYTGGNYQQGRYVDHGRSYNGRYYHNGSYYYGGSYRQNGTTPPSRDHRQSQDRHDGPVPEGTRIPAARPGSHPVPSARGDSTSRSGW